DVLDVTFQFAGGQDTYKGEGHNFGLLDNTNKSFNVGVNVTPRKTVGVGANYGWERYTSLQSSRNANPPGTDYGSWTDPNRTWNLDNDELVHNFDIYLDLNRTIHNTDIKFAYDFSDSDQGFVHSGPRIQELLTNNFFTPGDTRP